MPVYKKSDYKHGLMAATPINISLTDNREADQ